MRGLLRLLEHFPTLLDDILKHLGTLWDILGLFGPVLAIVGVATIGIGASLLQERWLARRLISMRSAARADEALEPVLDVSPRPKGLRRIRKRRDRILSVRLDEVGLVISRRESEAQLIWADVKRWDRDGLAEWTLWDTRGTFALALKREHGFTEDQLKRIDNRVALHTAELPHRTLRERLPGAANLTSVAGKLRGRRSSPSKATQAVEIDSGSGGSPEAGPGSDETMAT